MKIETKVPKQNPQFRLEQMDDEHLLYSPLHTKTIYLNFSAALVWDLCDGENTVDQIVEVLEQSFPESKQQIRTDVMHSIDELVKNQALFLD